MSIKWLLGGWNIPVTPLVSKPALEYKSINYNYLTVHQSYFFV